MSQNDMNQSGLHQSGLPQNKLSQHSTGQPAVRQFAVIGNPIAHSLSPLIHQAFGAATGIQLNYERLLSTPEQFATDVMAFFAQGGSGMNATVPFKTQAWALCDGRVTERAGAAQAVNTLYLQDQAIWGDNTDGGGLVSHLQQLGWLQPGCRILLLGAGGATRGVLLPLLDAGAGSITIANRTVQKAHELVRDFSSLTRQPLQASELSQLAGHYDLVINATSASLQDAGIQLPAALQFDHAYEMAYGKPSAFLEQAQSQGATVSDGLGMLLGQAALAFAIWHGVLPPLSAAEQALANRSSQA